MFPLREGIPARIKRRVCAPDPFQQIGLVPYVDTVHNRLTVEIRRGCTRGCRCGPWRWGLLVLLLPAAVVLDGGFDATFMSCCWCCEQRRPAAP